MPARLKSVVIDARDVEKVAAFWSAVLGWDTMTDDDGDVTVFDPNDETSVRLLVLAVPVDKTVKNRLHLDITPHRCAQDEELARLLALGAQKIDIGQGDRSWIVLADIEGNEFCLLAQA